MLRLLEWVAFEAAAIWFVMAYAAKVKKNPSKSVVGVGAGKIQVSMDQQVPFTAKRNHGPLYADIPHHGLCCGAL